MSLSSDTKQGLLTAFAVIGAGTVALQLGKLVADQLRRWREGHLEGRARHDLLLR